MDSDGLSTVALADRDDDSPARAATPPRRRRTALIVAGTGAAGALAAAIAVAVTMSGSGTEVATSATSATEPTPVTAAPGTTVPALAFTPLPAGQAPSATTPTTTPSTTPPAPPTPTPRMAPAPAAASTPAVAAACAPIATGATTLAPGCWIESASNGDFFGFGITPQPASGSAITITRGQVWKGLIIYGQPTGDGATIQADLTNDSGQTMGFPSGLAITVELTTTGASPVTVTLSDSSVRTLAPGAHVQLTQVVPLSSPGTYYVGGTTTFTVG